MSDKNVFIKVVLLAFLAIPCSAVEKSSSVNPRVSEVANSLRQLIMPSKMAENLRQTKFNVKPYIKVIDNGDGKSTLVYRCRFTAAKALVNAVESMISSHGIVEQAKEQNLIVINDKTDRMKALEKVLLAMDVSSPQILVEAKVVEVLVSDGVQRDLSVTWNQHNSRQNLDSTAGVTTTVPNQSTSDMGKGADVDFFPVIAGGIGDSTYSNLNASLQWLLKAEDAKILSAPNVIVSRNATASIVTGTDLPIQTIQVVSGSTSTSTEFKRIGVILKVTPSLINDDYVTIQVNPQVSNVQRYENIKQGETSYPVPVISIRNIETELTLKDGQIVMLGGLYTSKDISASEKTPFLSDIPLIGDLFTGKNISKEVTQLIFFLKISILTQEELSNGIIYDPGRQADELRKIGNSIQRSKDIFPKRIDNAKDQIKAVMRFEDSEGNVDIVGDSRYHENPPKNSYERKGDKEIDKKVEALDGKKDVNKTTSSQNVDKELEKRVIVPVRKDVDKKPETGVKSDDVKENKDSDRENQTVNKYAF